MKQSIIALLILLFVHDPSNLFQAVGKYVVQRPTPTPWFLLHCAQYIFSFVWLTCEVVAL
jgi:hypothetical protein